MKIPRKLVGNLIEIKLSKGFAYGLCTHDLKTQGQVILLYRDILAAALENPVTSLADTPVIPPFLLGSSRRIHAAVFSFIAGVMPPIPILGRSLL